MVRLRACHSPNPRLQPLLDGTVTAKGIEFEWESLGPQQLFHHQLTENDFDVFEFSISNYMITKERPKDLWDWTAIPIFFSFLPLIKPGLLVSTTNSDRFWWGFWPCSVRAATMHRSHRIPLVMNVLAPLST